MQREQSLRSKAVGRDLLARAHFWIGLALIAIFWPASWLHWGLLGEYAFFPLWLGYILTVDAVVAYRRGGSLLTRQPGLFLALFALSAPVWWVFEGGNNFTLNWHYLVDKPYSPLHVIVESTVDFSTVIPAVFETTGLVLTFDFVRRWKLPSFHHPLSRALLWSLMYVGALMFLGAILFPTVAFPFIWTWLFLLVDPLNALCGRPSLLEKASRGDFRMAGALAVGVLICAFFWEMWNYYSMPKWFYTVPYFDNKIFEMPAAGYLGYIPFSWELYALYQFILGFLRIGHADSPFEGELSGMTPDAGRTWRFTYLDEEDRMAQLGLSEAGEALRDFFGPQLDASEGEGPNIMADALVENKHITKDEAQKLVTDLIKAESVVFRPGKRPGDVPADANVVGAQVGSEGYPVGAAVELPKHGGYWQFK